MTTKLEKWFSPVRTRENKLEAMDDLFTNVFSTPFFSDFFTDNSFTDKVSYPKVDIIEYDEYVKILAEVHNVDKNNISVKIDKNVLTIAGKREEIEDSSESTRYIRKEIKKSNFQRSFTLTDAFDKKSISAKYDEKKGVLIVILNKVKKENTDTSIDIKVE